MATDETRFELKVSDSSKNFLEKKKEEHRRERSNSRQQEDGERRSSFVLLGDTSTAKKRTENKFNSMYKYKANIFQMMHTLNNNIDKS